MAIAVVVLGAGNMMSAQAQTPAIDLKPFVHAADEADLTASELLGKRLFEDATLSEPRRLSCQSCHDPRHAFQGNNGSRIAAVARGAPEGTFGVRKVPTLMYKSFSPPFGFYMDAENGKKKLQARGGQFWDGRAGDLSAQFTVPLLNPVEMNNASLDVVVAKVRAGAYADLARAVAGADGLSSTEAAVHLFGKALAAFEASPRFAPFSSKFDDYLLGKTQLSDEEMFGLQLFINPRKGNCIACHDGAPQSRLPSNWLLTDFTYDVLGVPRNREIPANRNPKFFDLGLCAQPGIEAHLPATVPLASLCGAFKVPTLRNVAVTGPYFHNGAIRTLREAVAFYATRDTNPERWYPRTRAGRVQKLDDLPPQYRDNVNVIEVPYDRKPGRKPRLNAREVDAIVAFLKTLTDKGMDDETTRAPPP